MPATVAELQVVVSADTKSAESDLSSFGGKMGTVGSAIGAGFAVAGAAVAGGLAIAVKAAGDLQQAVANVSTIKPEIDVSTVSAALTEMSTRVAQSSGDLAESLYNVFSSVEVTQAQALMLTEQFAQGAVAAQTDAETFGTAVMGVMNAYGMSVEEAGHISDVFFNTVNKGVVTGPELAASLGPVTQSAKAAGVGLDELGAMIAAVTKEGGPAAQNINNLNNFLQKITTTAAQGELENLGIKTKTMTGEFRPTADVLTDLKARLAGMTEAGRANALQAIFPDAQARIGAQTLISQLDLVTSATEDNAKAQGVASAAYEKMSATFNSQSKILVNSLMAVATSIGTELLPHITPLVSMMARELPGAFATTRAAVMPVLADLADSMRTVQQVMAGDWEPDEGISEFTLQVGLAASEVKQLTDWLGKVASAAGSMGAWDSFARGFTTLGKEIDTTASSLGKIVSQLDSMTTAAGTTGTTINLVASGVRIAGAGFEIWALSMGQATDTMTTLASTALSFISVLGNVGRAWLALATGDMPAFEDAQADAAQSFVDLVVTANDFKTRTAARVSEGFAAMGLSAQSGMADTTAAVEAGMSASTAAVDVGMQAVETSAATGMAGATAAVAAEGPALAAAAGADMAGASAAVAAEAPAMAAAAGEGAAGAVAAVEGQAGAAAGAGQSLGAALGSGLEGGIMAYVGRVANAARQMVSAAIGAANQEADAHSPSKKMEKLGDDLMMPIEDRIKKSTMADEMKTAMRDLLQTARDYVPTAREIARVEAEIRDIRERSTTAALFRAEEMVTLESELLRLKREQTEQERRLLPIRQDLADAEKQVRDLAAGSVADRAKLLENDAARKELRLATLALEQQLVGLDRDSKRAEGIQKQIDKLRDQDQLLGIEADRIRTTNDLAATAERRRVLGLGEILAAQEKGTTALNNQIAVLGAEDAVVRANEAIIKNATDNEIAYRQRLIAVFTAEGKPLADRLTAGLALVDQLEAEGKISKELADKIKESVKQTGEATTATAALGTASAVATPQIDAAAQKAAEMAKQAKAIAEETDGAAGEVDSLAKSLGKLPSWFTAAGSKKSDGLFNFGGGKASGGPISAGTSYLVGENGPEMITPHRDAMVLPLTSARAPAAGPPQTMTINVSLGGQVARRIVVEGYDIAVRSGWTPAGFTG